MNIFRIVATLGALALLVSCRNSTSGGTETTHDAGTSGSIGGATSAGGTKSTGGSGAAGGRATSTSAAGNPGTGGSRAVGGSATNSGGSSNPGTGGAGAVGGSDAGTCNMPMCLFNLYSTCSPAGSCVTQNDPSTNQTNTCYGNGTKAIVTTNPTTYATTMTFKNGSTICYSLELSLTNMDTATTYKNGSGTIVATSIWSSATQVETVTCTGGQPVAVTCDQVTTVIPNCTAGICTAD